MVDTQRYILALDQGTTSSRSCIFNKAGQLISIAQQEFKQLYPKPGWVEHNPEDLWSSQITTARQAITSAGLKPEQIAAIGITNQRESVVLWDKTSGIPVYNAIVWQCRRSAKLCDELKAQGLTQFFNERTGLVLDPYFSGTKVAWLLKEFPTIRDQAERGELAFGTIDSWLLYKLTGEHLTDPSNASRTLMFNINTLKWDEDLLKILGIPAAILPQVRPSSGRFAETKPELFGLAIPVTGCAGDQQAALFGHVGLEAGSVKNTYGTGCFTLLNTGSQIVYSKNNLLTTIAWQIGNEVTYALEGSVFIAGALIQWLRDELGLITSAEESEALAGSVADSAGVFIVPAFVGLGAPYWDSKARGTILGLTRGSNKAHLVRAALESIAFQTADLIEAMRADYGCPIMEVRADGGASANSLLMQFQADLLGCPVLLSDITETTALGAAYLAGLAIGYWSGQNELMIKRKTAKQFKPSISPENRNTLLKQWRAAIRTTLVYRSEA